MKFRKRESESGAYVIESISPDEVIIKRIKAPFLRVRYNPKTKTGTLASFMKRDESRLPFTDKEILAASKKAIEYAKHNIHL